MSVVIQAGAFGATREYDSLVEAHPGAAVVTFTGYVRDFSGQRPVETLELEHYPGMAERVLEALGVEASRRFGLRGWRIVHRYGCLAVAEPIVWAGVVADHRADAFAACEFVMDALKTDAPFWKREHGQGQSSWVAARITDDERRARWNPNT